MAENSMWFYKPSDNAKFDPAAQAQATQKKTEVEGKANIAAQDSGVKKWDDAHAKVVNDKNAPTDYVNDEMTKAVKWLDAMMSKMTGNTVHHDNPMGYISSGQANQDALEIKNFYKDDPAIVAQANNVVAIVGYGPAAWSSTAGTRLMDKSKHAAEATHGQGGMFGFFNPDENKRTKEATAVEYAAAGYKDMLLDIKDVDKIKKAIQSAYVLYNKTGDDRYEDAGALARGMLAKQLGATQAGNYSAQREFYRSILDLSQAADAAVPDSPYVDTARYAIIRDALAKVSTELEKSYNKKDNGPSSTVTVADIKNSDKGGKK